MILSNSDDEQRYVRKLKILKMNWYLLFAINFILNIRYRNGRSIVEIISSKYGVEAFHCYRKLEKLHLKVEKLKLEESQ